MDSKSGRISRRVLLKTTFAAGLSAGVLGGLGMVASFLFPSGQSRPTRAFLGSVRSFPVGSKTWFNVVEGRDGLEALKSGQDPRPRQVSKSGEEREHESGARGGVWLVRLEHGFLALSSRCTHLGCTVPWRPDFNFVDPASGSEKRGWFRCPCHASTFTEAGVRVYGPAPRSLDLYDVRILGPDVYVDVTTLRKGTVGNAKFAVDPDFRA